MNNQNGTIFCQNCGTINSINENICTFCHQKLIKNNYVTPNNKQGIPNNQSDGFIPNVPYQQVQQQNGFVPNMPYQQVQQQNGFVPYMPYQQMQQQNNTPVRTPILNFFCLLSVAISYFLRFTPLWGLSYLCILIWLIVYVVLVNHYKYSGRDISSIKTTRNTVCILFVLLFCIGFVVYI